MQLDSYDKISTVLNVPTITAIFADIVFHFGTNIEALEHFTEWYTKGVGAIVVTVNAYILWKKSRTTRKKKNAE